MSNLPSLSGASLPAMTAPSNAAYDAVGANDIMMPKIYLMQPLSEFVQSGLAKPGDMLFATGTDDKMPVHLIGGDDDADHFNAYVVTRKKFAATTAGGGMTFHPDNKRDPNDSESWEGWFFDLAITEHETLVPVRWMLWRTAGTPAARTINTLIERAMFAGDADPVRIKVTVRQKTNRTGQKYYSPQVAIAEPDPSELEIAKVLQQRAIAIQAARGFENEPPAATVAQPSFS